MTLKDIAAMANVSVSAVSKALSNAYDIAPDTRRHILEVAARAGYFSSKKTIVSKNRSCQELRIALLCPEIISIYYADLLTGIIGVITAHRFESVVYVTDFDRQRTERILQQCIDDRKIAAVISLSPLRDPPKDTGTPLLLFQETACCSAVFCSAAAAIECAVQHLCELGHRHIVFISEELTQHKSVYFRQALQSRGIPLPLQRVLIVRGRFETAGADAAAQLLSGDAPLPTAALCAYDEIACGLIAALQQRGVAVPQELSVMGINNIPLSSYCFGGLTTVSVTDVAVIKQAIDDLLTGIARKEPQTPRQYAISPQLIQRTTVRAVSV